MKKLLMTLFLLIHQQLLADANAGGMDGGGGGTLPTRPVPTYKVKDIVHEAKPKLLYFFNEYEWHLKYSSNSLLTKLYLGPRKVQEVLKGLRVEVRMEQPCLTSAGKEVDASIHAIKPNTICISAQRISQKIDEALAEREVLALLAHEVSHFMEANEAEATELQKDLAYVISANPKDVDFDVRQIKEDLSSHSTVVHKIIDAIQGGQFTLASQAFSKLYSLQVSLWEDSSNRLYSLFSPREYAYQFLMHRKLLWANNYLDTLIEGPGQIEAQKRYETRFGDRDHFLLRDEMSFDHLYANEKIYKINSAAELIRLLQSLKLEYAVRSAYAWQSYYGADWLNLDGHLTKTFANPWSQFQGTYTIQTAQCSNPSDYQKDLRQIQIYSAADVLYMRRSTPNGSGINSIELGAYWMNASLNDYGQLAANKVYLTLAAGGSWSQRVLQDHHISRQTLETNPDQTFKLTIENTFEHHDVTKPDAKSSCVFTGTFQKR